MDRSEIIKKAKLIYLQSRKLLPTRLLGDNRSIFNGTGFEFDQLAEYQFGSDIRFIDWKSSARAQKLLIKEFREEKSRLIQICLDISRSQHYSSGQAKEEYIKNIAAILCMAGVYGKDSVSLTLFSDVVNRYIPVGRSIAHGFRMVEALYSEPLQGRSTSVACAVDHLNKLQKGPAFTIVLSDGIDTSLDSLRRLQQKGEVLYIRCLDPRERSMAINAIVTLRDLESGEYISFDLSRSDVRKAYFDRLREQDIFFRQAGIDCIDVIPGKTTVEDFAQALRKRTM